MIIYWNTHKIPLTPEEVDSNFHSLETELQDAKNQLAELRTKMQRLEVARHVSQTAFDISYQNHTLSLNVGEQTARVSLPLWSFKGPWCDTELYDAGDLVVYEGRIYHCNTGTQDSPLKSSWDELPFQSTSATQTMLPASPVVNSGQ